MSFHSFLKDSVFVLENISKVKKKTFQSYVCPTMHFRTALAFHIYVVKCYGGSIKDDDCCWNDKFLLRNPFLTGKNICPFLAPEAIGMKLNLFCFSVLKIYNSILGPQAIGMKF